MVKLEKIFVAYRCEFAIEDKIHWVWKSCFKLVWPSSCCLWIFCFSCITNKKFFILSFPSIKGIFYLQSWKSLKLLEADIEKDFHVYSLLTFNNKTIQSSFYMTLQPCLNQAESGNYSNSEWGLYIPQKTTESTFRNFAMTFGSEKTKEFRDKKIQSPHFAAHDGSCTSWI